LLKLAHVQAGRDVPPVLDARHSIGKDGDAGQLAALLSRQLL
jgi:hypothetical protein